MRKPLPRVRYIEPASVQPGDLIRATTRSGDLETSHVGRVGRIHYEGPVRIILTPDGQEIMRWQPMVKYGKVTLLETGPGMQPEPMFDMDMFPETKARLA